MSAKESRPDGLLLKKYGFDFATREHDVPDGSLLPEVMRCFRVKYGCNMAAKKDGAVALTKDLSSLVTLKDVKSKAAVMSEPCMAIFSLDSRKLLPAKVEPGHVVACAAFHLMNLIATPDYDKKLTRQQVLDLRCRVLNLYPRTKAQLLSQYRITIVASETETIKPEHELFFLVLCKFHCNNFQDQHDPDTYLLYDTISHINHDCAPNCHFDIGKDAARTMTIVANRDMDASSLVTVSYRPFCYDDVVKRRQDVKREFGFLCCCDTCSKQKTTPEQVLHYPSDDLKMVIKTKLCVWCGGNFKADRSTMTYSLAEAVRAGPRPDLPVKCDGCNLTLYCSVECRTSHGKIHKVMCNQLIALLK